MSEARLGDAVRRLREAQELSLRAVAERAGFSPSFLSQVENGQASPSIASMERIAAALSVSLGEFFELAARGTAINISRAGDHTILHSEWSKAQIASLGTRATSRLEPIIVTLKPGGSSGKDPHPAPTDEFALVLEGTVTLTMQDGVHVLHAGDAVTVRPNGLRRWHNEGPDAVRILIVAAR